MKRQKRSSRRIFPNRGVSGNFGTPAWAGCFRTPWWYTPPSFSSSAYPYSCWWVIFIHLFSSRTGPRRTEARLRNRNHTTIKASSNGTLMMVFQIMGPCTRCPLRRWANRRICPLMIIMKLRSRATLGMSPRQRRLAWLSTHTAASNGCQMDTDAFVHCS